MKRQGINTPADLRARCRVLRCGCWEWQGAKDANGRPSFWFPPVGARVSLGVAACWWARGRRPEKGENWHAPASCELRDCANPAHRVCGTRSTQMLAQGMKRTLHQRLRVAKGKRRLSDAAVAEIQAWRGPLAEIAQKHGVSVGWACSLRTGKASRLPLIAPDAKVIEAKPHNPRMGVQRVFSSLRIGSYLPERTVIARAYQPHQSGEKP